MPSPLRGICIGAGYFSRFHCEAWARIPEVRIVALVERDLERARVLAAEHGIPQVISVDDLDALLDRERPDFVDLITPPTTHLDLVRRVAARGIAIICQKPLAPTLSEATEVVAAARAGGARLMVHENWRWQPWYREMRRQLDNGTLGELFLIAVRMRLGDGWPADAYRARQPYFRDYPRLLVHETGVHFLDTFRFLGGEIESVYARLQRRNPGIAGEDSGQIVCGFASGATALLDASRYNEADTSDARHTFGTVRIDGSRGHLELALDGTLTLKPLSQTSVRLDYPHTRHGFAGDCVHALQRHFIESLIANRPFESTGEDYLKTIALVEACYRSHDTGQPISPAPPRP